MTIRAKPLLTLLLSLPFLLLLQACDTAQPPISSDGATAQGSSAIDLPIIDPNEDFDLDAAVLPISHDKVFVRVAREIPGFAGVFIDDNDTPNVATTTGDVPAALLGSLLPEGPVGDRIASGDFEVYPVNFDYLQLARWRIILNNLLIADGVRGSTIYEIGNTVELLVDNDAIGETVVAHALAMGFPEGAVSYLVMDEYSTLAGKSSSSGNSSVPCDFPNSFDLQECQRPYRAGLELGIRDASGNPEINPSTGGTYFCSIGMVGTKTTPPFDNADIMLTASHCTTFQQVYDPNGEIRGGVEGTQFTQPANVFGSTPSFADEIVDPVFTTCPSGFNTPPGARCRWSDSAMAEVRSNSTSELAKGTIWQTTQRAPAGGSTNIPMASNNFLTINAQAFFTFLGDEVEKIGRTTGWSYGDVFRTSVTMEVPINTESYPKYLLEQTFVDSPGVGTGDSGGVVFTREGDPSFAQYAGLIWAQAEAVVNPNQRGYTSNRGSGPVQGNRIFIYSDWENLIEDLGSFRFTATPTQTE